jgi:F-box protein 3
LLPSAGGIRLMRAVPATTPPGTDLVSWLDEWSRRVEAGVYTCENIDADEHRRDFDTPGICLFPQAGPKQSVATTRGIRVTASAIYAPELGMFVYSIRLRLLSADEEGGLSPAERGFETAQLRSRHWILGQTSGPPETVNGAGVVGRYPLLFEGGWREDRQTDASGTVRPGHECDGTFIYQSMSGRGPTCSFEGELEFVPGSLRKPAGEPFRVTVGRFPLECRADEFLM